MSRSADDEHSETDPGWAQARNQLFRMIMEGRSFSGRERNCCFLNTGKTRFATVSAVSGLDYPDDGRCIAVSDWDRDGDLDLWISNRNAPRLRFMRNDTPSGNRYLRLRLVGDGEQTNRDAIGARVTVNLKDAAADNLVDSEASRPTLIQTLRAGEGFLSQSSKWLHFGLAQADAIDSVTVLWPGGEPQTYAGLQPNHRYHLRQKSTQAELVDGAEPATAVRAGVAKLPVQSRAARVVLQTRVPMPSLTYTSADGKIITERFDDRRPTLVNLWASWCQPCVQELSELTADRQRLSTVGLRIISLSVDQLGDRQASPQSVRELLQRIDYPYTTGDVDDDQMQKLQELNDQFFFLRRTLPLPSSFLVDDAGNLSVIYRGPVEVGQLLSDVALTVDDYRTSFEAAACVPGRSLRHHRILEVADRTELQTRYRVASWLSRRGQPQDAIEQFIDLATSDPNWALPMRRLATLYLDQQNLPLAERFALRAEKIEPKNADLQNTLGLIRSRQGNPQAAESHFRQAIQVDSAFAGAYNNLGIALAMQGKINPAGKCFQQAVRIDGTFADAHANLGNVYASRGDTELAIKHYQLAIEIDPANVEPYNNLGTMFGRLGNIQRAIDYYRQALKIDPANNNARRNLDRAIQRLNSRP